MCFPLMGEVRTPANNEQTACGSTFPDREFMTSGWLGMYPATHASLDNNEENKPGVLKYTPSLPPGYPGF